MKYSFIYEDFLKVYFKRCQINYLWTNSIVAS